MVNKILELASENERLHMSMIDMQAEIDRLTKENKELTSSVNKWCLRTKQAAEALKFVCEHGADCCNCHQLLDKCEQSKTCAECPVKYALDRVKNGIISSTKLGG